MTTPTASRDLIVCDLDDLEFGETVEPPAPECRLILWNDDTSHYQTVLRLLTQILGYSTAQGIEKIGIVEVFGKAVVFRGSRELCELRHEQFRAAKLTTTIEQPR